MPFQARRARKEAERAEKRARTEAEKEARAYLAEHEPIASWGNRIHLCHDHLVRLGARVGPQRQPAEIVPVDGVRAQVGAAAPAPSARWRQNLEARQVWLTISGRGFRWDDPVPVKVADVARDFARAVNDHAGTRPSHPKRRAKGPSKRRTTRER